MPIRYCVGEPGDMVIINQGIGGFVTSTSAGLKNSWSRLAFRTPYSNDMQAEGIANLPHVDLGASLNTGWFHMRYYFPYYSVFSFTVPSIGLMNDLGNFVIGPGRMPGTTKDVCIFDRLTGTNNVTESADVLAQRIEPSDDGRVDVDIYWNIDAVNGFHRVFVDGILVYQFLGDTATGGGPIRYICFGNSNGGNDIDWCWHSELIVADEPTIGARLYTLGITGEGTDQDWVGAHTDVNHTGFDDLSFVYTANDQERQSFNLDIPASLETGHIIRGVFLTHRSQKEIFSSINQIQPYLMVGGTRYDIGSGVSPPDLPPTNYSADSQISPVTLNLFDITEIQGMELGFRAVV